MLVKPFLKITKTLQAPHLRADVAQSKAVSPAPKTMTLPWSCGICVLQEHIPVEARRLHNVRLLCRKDDMKNDQHTWFTGH